MENQNHASGKPTNSERSSVNFSKVVSTISVVSVGDLLISQRVLNGARQENKNGVCWDFRHIFQYTEPYIKDADYAVINLETCFAGEKEEYCGFPRFNSPDSAFEAAREAGFDMFLTASNHTYDMGYDALIHKIQMLENAKVDYIGTRLDESRDLHKVVEVNGIRIGMLNYAKETASSTKERVVLNTTRTGPDRSWESAVLDERAQKLIATYNNKHLDDFFAVLEADIQTLKHKGADILVAYPHWGRQYDIGYYAVEDRIAQKMCDLGVDVIIGGHPHVVEPVKVYTSAISGKTTLCIHSTGNFVSSMDRSVDEKYGEYTKDGVIFKYTAKKYADGSTVVTSAEALPVWVYFNKGRYIVVPLDREVDWRKAYAIATYEEQKRGYESFHRTDSLVREGIACYNAMAKIAVQPKDTRVEPGKKARFSVTAIGKNMTYRWQHSRDGGETWVNCTQASANKAVLTIESVGKEQLGRQYRCVITTPAGSTFSRAARLAVARKTVPEKPKVRSLLDLLKG